MWGELWAEGLPELPVGGVSFIQVAEGTAGAGLRLESSSMWLALSLSL